MIQDINVQEAVNNLQGSGKTFAEFLATLFKDKFIEIYLGDSYEDISVDQISTAYPAVICGKVIAAYRECLVINCAYVENKKIVLGKLMFINERAIRALTEINGRGVLEDMLLKSRESVRVKQIFEASNE